MRKLLALLLIALALSACAKPAKTYYAEGTVTVTRNTCPVSEYTEIRVPCGLYELTVQCEEDPVWCLKTKALQERYNRDGEGFVKDVGCGHTTSIVGNVDGLAIGLRGGCGISAIGTSTILLADMKNIEETKPVKVTQPDPPPPPPNGPTDLLEEQDLTPES